MKTMELKLYKYEELSPKAKAVAKREFKQHRLQDVQNLFQHDLDVQFPHSDLTGLIHCTGQNGSGASAIGYLSLKDIIERPEMEVYISDSLAEVLRNLIDMFPAWSFRLSGISGNLARCDIDGLNIYDHITLKATMTEEQRADLKILQKRFKIWLYRFFLDWEAEGMEYLFDPDEDEVSDYFDEAGTLFFENGQPFAFQM